MKFSDYLIGNQGGEQMSSQTSTQPQQMQSIAPQQSMQSSVTDFGIKPNQSAPKKKVDTFDVLGMLEKTNQFTQKAIKDNPAPVKLRTEEESQSLKNKIADYAVRLDKGVESIRDEYDIPKEDIIKIGDEYRQYLESKGVAIDENTTTHADLAYEAIKNGSVPGIEKKERSAFGKLIQGGGNFLAGWTDLSGAGELGIKAGKLSAPILNTIRKALGKKELSEEDINNLAEKQRIEDESNSFSSVLGNKNTTAGSIGKGLKDIVATVGGGEIAGINKIASGASKLAGGGIKGAIAGGATLGALETPIYTAVSEGRLPTKEEAGLGVVLGGGLPAIGGLLSAGIKKLPVMIGKSAEGLSVKGLLNAKDAKKIVRTLKETGEGDVGSIGRWALERDIAGKTTEDALKAAGDIASKNYKGVRDAVMEVSDNLGPLGKDLEVAKAMTMVGKQADAINARAGYDAINKAEIDGLLAKATDGTIDLNGKQRAKELIDEFVNIYKQSGDVADTQIADVADSVRQSIRRSIEDTVDYATDGKINIREMNREVAVAKAFQRGIENKATANELKQFALQSSYGAIAGAGGEFRPDSPERRGRVILGGIVGKQIGSMLGNPAIMGKIAKSLDKLSFGSRSNILKYMKYPTRTKLTEKSLEDLLSIKKSVVSDPEITSAIKLLKEGQLESNPIRLTTPKKTRTLGPGATQQTKRPLSSNINENGTNPINNTSSNSLGDNTSARVKKKPVQSDTLVSKSDIMEAERLANLDYENNMSNPERIQSIAIGKEKQFKEFMKKLSKEGKVNPFTLESDIKMVKEGVLGERASKNILEERDKYISKQTKSPSTTKSETPSLKTAPSKELQPLYEEAPSKELNTNTFTKSKDITNEQIGYKKKELPTRALESIQFEGVYISELRKKNTRYIEKYGIDKFNEEALQKYKDNVKYYISKGYDVPQKIIDKYPEFSKAVDARARYEKGLYTSFSNKDIRIDKEAMDKIGGGIKRQDGKELTVVQKDEIIKGVQDFSDTLGIDMKKIAQENNIVFVHLNGKNAFLRKASGLHRKSGDSYSISVGGKETITEVVNGKRVTEQLNTTMQHELGHAIDGLHGNRLLGSVVRDATRTYNPVDYLRKYFRKDEEITARLIEQYVAVKKGHTSYYDKPGFWKKEKFDELLPRIEDKIREKFPTI